MLPRDVARYLLDQSNHSTSLEMLQRVDSPDEDRRDEDAPFVARCRRGDVDAFEVLVARHQQKMLNAAYRMTGDYDEACDVVQEAFLSAWRGIAKFRGEARFSTWLYGIVMNHARNSTRKARARGGRTIPPLADPPRGEATDGGEGWCSAASETMQERMERREREAKVQEGISALDGEQREVLVLRDIQGCTYDEIGRMLKLPEGTVKSRLFRARAALRDYLLKALGDWR
jgi:RNA polymerase sigma-70 factor, ECF subfamily